MAVGTECGVTERVTEADPAKKHLLNQDKEHSSAITTLCLDLCESCSEKCLSRKLFGQRSDFPQAWLEFKLGVVLLECVVLSPLPSFTRLVGVRIYKQVQSVVPSHLYLKSCF